jgi:hypothetical protein
MADVMFYDHCCSPHRVEFLGSVHSANYAHVDKAVNGAIHSPLNLTIESGPIRAIRVPNPPSISNPEGFGYRVLVSEHPVAAVMPDPVPVVPVEVPVGGHSACAAFYVKNSLASEVEEKEPELVGVA